MPTIRSGDLYCAGPARPMARSRNRLPYPKRCRTASTDFPDITGVMTTATVPFASATHPATVAPRGCCGSQIG
jgi:hypothetical protein